MSGVNLTWLRLLFLVGEECRLLDFGGPPQLESSDFFFLRNEQWNVSCNHLELFLETLGDDGSPIAQ